MGTDRGRAVTEWVAGIGLILLALYNWGPDLADRLSDRFDTRVKVDIGRNKGKITIEFATVDDLERIVGMIGVEEEGADSSGG